MHPVNRRDFIKGSVAAGLTFGLSRPSTTSAASAKPASPNEDVRLAIIGLGGIDIPGSVGGRGRQLIETFKKVPGARITALCDIDSDVLQHGAALMKKAGISVVTYNDLRRALDDKDIDAVVVATPNHWHALAAVWACQAGKDAYVEKPLSYNIWEGRQIVAAAKKYNRIIQVGTQARSSPGLRDALEFVRGGKIGKIQYAHVLVYRPRESMGKVTQPTPIPPSVDYNQWCGPAPMGPLMRKHLHYDWHWVWPTGTGEIGNNGIHYLDMARRALGITKPPARAMSFGGRFVLNDDGETPNTHVAFLDCEPAPIICEIRGLTEKPGAKEADKLRGMSVGVLIQCEGGYFTGSHPGGKVFDNQGKEIRDITGPPVDEIEVLHGTNFIEAIRNRSASSLAASALEGHLSATCFHVANVSYRIGGPSSPNAIREACRSNDVLADAFERYEKHLAIHGVDMGKTPTVLGPWVTLNPRNEQFAGQFADKANRYAIREYRSPFVVPVIG